MRRLAFIFVLALVAVPAAAVAADRSTGDGAFELRAANGTAILTGRGVLWGQLDYGSLRVSDPTTANSPPLLVSGAEHTRPVGENVTVYWGTNITFRITGGKYRIRFKGSGLDLTAIGSGTADLTGDPTAETDGTYALDSGKWQPVPLLEKVVTYGTPTTTTTTTTGSQTGP